MSLDLKSKFYHYSHERIYIHSVILRCTIDLSRYWVYWCWNEYCVRKARHRLSNMLQLY